MLLLPFSCPNSSAVLGDKFDQLRTRYATISDRLNAPCYVFAFISFACHFCTSNAQYAEVVFTRRMKGKRNLQE